MVEKRKIRRDGMIVAFIFQAVSIVEKFVVPRFLLWTEVFPPAGAA